MTSPNSARNGCTKPVVVFLSGLLFLVSALLTMNVSTNIMNATIVGDNAKTRRFSTHFYSKENTTNFGTKINARGINGGNLRSHGSSSLVTQAGPQVMIPFKPETSCYIYRYSDHGVKKLKPKQQLRKLGCTRRPPKALIIGVKKCATGTLQSFLDLHPQLETVHENRQYREAFSFTSDIGNWMTQLPLSTSDQMTIVGIPRFIFQENRQHKMDPAIPDLKLILILCDPVKRAISDYVHVKACLSIPQHREETTYKYDEQRARNITLFQGYELFGSTFEETITDNHGNLNTSHVFIQHGIYIKAIQTLFHNFDRERTLIIDGHEFKQNPHCALKEVERFLGLSAFFKEEQFYFSSIKGLYCANVTDRPDVHCMSSSKDAGGKGRLHPSVDQNLLQQMLNFFTPYNSQLKDYLNRTLTFT
ncbi:heparan sulfate glucosamine 3-O-sulfotransferase 1-like [Amphiura filiformis]|uniref:heparan sulfate glucosamine 3-O-sulfotransferase 1-like n=1 Tax=Amphiura filiformis TaxID=82378 RepID=UPI003B227D3D